MLIYNAGMDPHQASLGGLPGITFSVLSERERLVSSGHCRDQCQSHSCSQVDSSRELTKHYLSGLHRLTIAAAAQVNAGNRSWLIASWTPCTQGGTGARRGSPMT